MLFFAIIPILLWSSATNASLLGTVPRVDTGQVRLLTEMQSDLWTSPNQEKADPLRRYNLAGKLPVLFNDRWSASLNLEAEGLRIGRPGLIIGNDAIEVNTDLRSQSAGVGVQRRDEDGSWFSLFGSYESASNEPFKDKRDRYFAGTAIYAFEPSEKWQWIVGANQSNNRGIRNGQIMPIGGVFYRPNLNLTVAFGLPFLLIEWKNESSVFNLTATLVGIEGNLRKDFANDFFYQFKSGLSSRAYLHNDRIKDKNRIFFEEKYIEGGVGVRLSARTHTVLVIGQSFDRRVYEAEAIFKKTGTDHRIKADLYGTLGLEFIL